MTKSDSQKQFFKVQIVLLATLWIVIGLAGCTPLVRLDQPGSTKQVVLQPGEPIGQTFVARYGGLRGIRLQLKPETPAEGTVSLHLRSDPQSQLDLAVAHLSLQSIQSQTTTTFDFPPLEGSSRQYFYFFLDIEGSGQVLVSMDSGAAYLNGALYQNHKPIDSQLTFHLVYDSWHALSGILREAAHWLGILLVGIFLFILPGWALLQWAAPFAASLSWEEKLGLSAGISLAVYPLLILWTNLLNIRLGLLYAWLPALSAISYLIWKNRQAFNWRRLPLNDRLSAASQLVFFRSPRFSIREWVSKTGFWPDLTLVAVLGLIFLTRSWVVRNLEAPLWGDSYQHTMITQLLVDHGGLFDSWEPYASLTSFTYHFGFHSAAAVFHWITHLPMTQATLWTGQLLNISAILVLYPLAVKIGRNRWAGVAALIVGGLLSQMPMFYTNWGRYTQLAGQVILPVMAYLVWASVGSRTNVKRLIVLSVISLAGLALTHYRILIFGVLFFPALLLLQRNKASIKPSILRLFWIATGAGVLFLPWFIHTFSGRITSSVAHQLSAPMMRDAIWAIGDFGSIPINLQYSLPPILWLLMALSTGWGLWKQEKGVFLVSSWWFFNLLATNPGWFGLSGSGTITNFALFIAFYIPASLLIGAGAGWLVTDLKNERYRRLRLERPGAKAVLITLLAAGLMLISLTGARQRLRDINAGEYAMVTRPDAIAAEWIKENLHEDSRFLINSFFAFSNSVVVGSDGGWWLPLLANRDVNVPPINYGQEMGSRSGYQLWVNEVTASILQKGIQSPEVRALLQERELDYIYIGQQQGRVNNGGPVIEPEILLKDPSFTPIYHEDRVWIFHIEN